MTAGLSVTHRGTGGALAGMMIAAAFGGVLLPMPFPEALALVQVSIIYLLVFPWTVTVEQIFLQWQINLQKYILLQRVFQSAPGPSINPQNPTDN